MFGYVSFAQLSNAIRSQLYAIPADVDLIVGIPRSGMVPAYQIGLFLNRLVCDIDSFIVEANNGRHGTFAGRHGLLHIATPQLHQAHGGFEINNLGRHQGRPFTQTMASQKSRRIAAQIPPYQPQRSAGGQQQ